jgi:tripartite-type tricarboxylate transporter receptor subunit TctC
MQNSWSAIKRIKRVLMLAPIVGALSFGTATAQSTYPDRPINMLVGFSAGGPTDTAARVLGEFLSQELGQPIVITNKPGAGGLVAARDLMNSQPDGYTIYLASNGIMTVAAARYEKLDYDPQQDMAAVGTVAGYPHILIVPLNSPFKSIADLVAAAKANPGTLNAAQVGNVNELTVEWIKNEAGIDVALIPYKGGAAVVSDLTSGRIDFALVAPGVAFPLLDGNKARALGATSDNSFTKKRGIPSFKAAGLGNIDFYIWNGLVAPKGTSPAIINKLSQATQKVLAMPALQKKLGVVFLDAVIGSPADFTQLIQNETASWKKVVTDANLTLLK